MRVIELIDKYYGDVGLIDEKWVSKKQRERDLRIIENGEAKLISEYEEALLVSVNDRYSDDMREQAHQKIVKIERYMDQDVIEVIKKRVIK